MNHIKGLWCLLKQHVMRRHPRSTTVPTLSTAINQEWTALSSQDIQQLTSTMPTRSSELLPVLGRHSRSWFSLITFFFFLLHLLLTLLFNHLLLLLELLSLSQ